MIAGLILAALLTLGALVYVLAPLFGAAAGRSESEREAVGELRELHAQQQMLLAALTDLEDDRLTHKIGDEDYLELKNRLSAEAIEVMRRLDEVERTHEQHLEQEREASRPLRHPAATRSGSESS